MSYEKNSCCGKDDCYGCLTEHMPTGCRSCVGDYNATSKALEVITQKRIWKTVRTSQSQYLTNLASQNVKGSQEGINWNQMSDRLVPSIQTAYVPSRGNSLRTTKTANRPGASGPAGVGVDVKHDSYARYLARRKAKTLRTNTSTSSIPPMIGNKNVVYGMIANCMC
jgi:hypothetical protein